MPRSGTIGTANGVSIDLAAWDAVQAQVDLSVACMFAHEKAGSGPAGGLRHLDEALGGALTTLRSSGSFKAAFMETLLVSVPQTGIAADALLIIGLGDPAGWTPATSASAVAAAVRQAAQRGARTVAFAPSLLDAGFDASSIAGVTPQMLAALVEALESQKRIAEHHLAPPLSLARWVFDVGAAHFDGAFAQFRDALSACRGASCAGDMADEVIPSRKPEDLA